MKINHGNLCYKLEEYSISIFMLNNSQLVEMVKTFSSGHEKIKYVAVLIQQSSTADLLCYLTFYSSNFLPGSNTCRGQYS